MTSFKFTAREVISVLKQRIVRLSKSMAKMEENHRIKLENLSLQETEYRLRAARLQGELNEKNGTIARYVEQIKNLPVQAMKQISNMELVLIIAKHLIDYGVSPTTLRNALMLGYPQAISEEFNDLVAKHQHPMLGPPQPQPWGGAPVLQPLPAAPPQPVTMHLICNTFGITPDAVRKLCVREPTPDGWTDSAWIEHLERNGHTVVEKRTFSMDEICKVFNVSAGQVLDMGNAYRAQIGAKPAWPVSVLTGHVDAAVLAGQKYGEFITVGGFPEASVPAASANGYAHYAYYINKAEVATLNQPCSDSVWLTHPDSVDVVNRESDATMVPVIITVLQ